MDYYFFLDETNTDQTQPYLTIKYQEIEADSDDSSNDGNSGSNSGGMSNGDKQSNGNRSRLIANSLINKINREKQLQLWWYPNNTNELEYGKWFYQSDDSNIHRDMQHRSLSQYGGMVRILTAMTRDDNDDTSNNSNRTF